MRADHVADDLLAYSFVALYVNALDYGLAISGKTQDRRQSQRGQSQFQA